MTLQTRWGRNIESKLDTFDARKSEFGPQSPRPFTKIMDLAPPDGIPWRAPAHNILCFCQTLNTIFENAIFAKSHFLFQF